MRHWARVFLSFLFSFNCAIAQLSSAESSGTVPFVYGNLSRISPILVQKDNPFNGRKHFCAAFARYGLYLLTGKRYATFGAAWHWARHVTYLKARIPIQLLQPGHLNFFKNRQNKIRHVAIVLATDFKGNEAYTITFQDERGTHSLSHPENMEYLGMRPAYGADPAKLETVNS